MINTFISNLQHRLSRELPGVDAHRIMMPEESTNARFELDQDDPKLGGVLVLLYQKKDELYIPLTQRHDYGGTHGNQVSFPGGKWEEGDQDLQYTAIREAHEEIGVPASAIQVLGKLTDLYIPPSNFRVSPVVAYASKQLHFKLDPFEVKELIEVPLTLLLRKTTLRKKKIPVRGTVINAPFFDIGGKVVWGATAMMLSELVTLIREIDPNLNS